MQTIIPKIFHFIWLGTNKPYLNGIRSKIKLYGSEFKYILWTDNLNIDIEDIKELEIRDIRIFNINDNNISCDAVCNNLNTLKSDLYRFIILYNFGGIYSDLDSISIRKLPTELYNHDFVTCYEHSSVNSGNYSGAIIGFFMACPKSEAIKQFLLLRELLPYQISSVKLCLLFGDIPNVKILSPESFCPLKINEIENITDCSYIYIHFNGCYELHLYHGVNNRRDVIF